MMPTSTPRPVACSLAAAAWISPSPYCVSKSSGVQTQVTQMLPVWPEPVSARNSMSRPPVESSPAATALSIAVSIAPCEPRP